MPLPLHLAPGFVPTRWGGHWHGAIVYKALDNALQREVGLTKFSPASARGVSPKAVCIRIAATLLPLAKVSSIFYTKASGQPRFDPAALLPAYRCWKERAQRRSSLEQRFYRSALMLVDVGARVVSALLDFGAV